MSSGEAEQWLCTARHRSTSHAKKREGSPHRLNVVAATLAPVPALSAVPEPVVAAPGAGTSPRPRRPVALALWGVLVVAPALAPAATVAAVPESVVAFTRLSSAAHALAGVLAGVRTIFLLGVVAPALAPAATVAAEPVSLRAPSSGGVGWHACRKGEGSGGRSRGSKKQRIRVEVVQ